MSEVNPRVVKIPNLQKWEYQSLEQLCSHVRRGTAPRYVEQSAVKAIGQRCVSKQGFDSSFARPHSERALDGTLQAIEGDVLLNSTGTGTIGRSVVFRENGTFIVDGHVTALRPKVSKCSSTWLSAVLQSPWGQEHLERFCYAGSTNQVELSASALRVSAVPAPSYDEQSKIAEILDTLDSAIRGTEAVVAKLKAMKQGLLHDLLTRGIDANGDLRLPQPEAPHLYKQTLLGWLPKEWDCVELDQIVDNQRPVVYGILMPGHGYEGGVPVIKVRDIVGGRILADQLLLTDPRIDFEYRRSRLKGGDLLFTIRGSVGRMAIVPDDLENANITQDTARLALKGVDARFVAAFLETEMPRRFISNHTIGVAVQGINLRDVRRIPMAKPTEGEDVVIAEKLSEMERKLSLEIAELDKLRLQKSGLMDDLLIGRTPVTALL